MKIKLTESELRKLVKESIKGVLSEVNVYDLTNRNFFYFSDARKKIERVERATGWKCTAFKNTGDDFIFVLGDNEGRSSSDEVVDFLGKVGLDTASVDKIGGGNAIKVTVRATYNREMVKFRNSAEDYAKKFSENPEPYKSSPAGVPEK